MALEIPNTNLFKTVSKDHTVLRDASTMIPSVASTLNRPGISALSFKDKGLAHRRSIFRLAGPSTIGTKPPASVFVSKGRKSNPLSRKNTDSKLEALWSSNHNLPITEEIVNLGDIEAIKTRYDYVKVEASKKRLSAEDFQKKVEIGSWQLLTLITDRDTFSDAVVFMSDPISNIFDLDMTFESGRNFLIYAVAKSEKVIIEKLIEMKPSLLNKTDDFGRTAVHYAVLLKKCKILSLLVDSGADFRLEDCNGQTPLHLAAQRYDQETYFFLKFRGADGLALDKVGLRPLDYIANEDEYNDIVLMEFGSPRRSKRDSRTRTTCLTLDNIFAQEPTVRKFPYFNPEKVALDRRRNYFYRLGIMRPPTLDEVDDGYCDRYEEAMRESYENHEKEKGSSAVLLPEKNNSMPLNLSRNAIKEEDLAPIKNLTCADGYLVNRKLSIQDIDVKGVIGKGSFGKIFCVTVRGTDKILAMKSYKKKDFLASSLVRFLFIEKKIMINFDHPFLVKLYYSFQNRDRLFVLMEYCEKRDLTKQVLKMDELQVKVLACELVLAIKALHDRGIIHRDIKPDNVFICADGHVKLGDFGLAKENVSKGSLHHTFCGSIAYLPPEVVLKTGHTKSIDWYLLGELLYEVVAGVPPFYGVGKEALMDNILHKELDFKDLQVSDSFRDLLSKLLCRDIHSRLGSRHDSLEVMEHHYFVGIDWSKVYAKQYPLFKAETLESYKLKRDSASELEANCSSSDEMNLPFWSFAR